MTNLEDVFLHLCQGDEIAFVPSAASPQIAVLDPAELDKPAPFVRADLEAVPISLNRRVPSTLPLAPTRLRSRTAPPSSECLGNGDGKDERDPLLPPLPAHAPSKRYGACASFGLRTLSIAKRRAIQVWRNKILFIFECVRSLTALLSVSLIKYLISELS